jgi:hypothetical protein
MGPVIQYSDSFNFYYPALSACTPRNRIVEMMLLKSSEPELALELKGRRHHIVVYE